MNNFNDIKAGDTVSFYPNDKDGSCLFGICKYNNIRKYTALVIGRYYDLVAALCIMPYGSSSTITNHYIEMFNIPEKFVNKYNGERFIGIRQDNISKFEIVSSSNIDSFVDVGEERGGLSFL